MNEAFHILSWLLREADDRPFIRSLIQDDLGRWSEIPDSERLKIFDRSVRRISAVSPLIGTAEAIQNARRSLIRDIRSLRQLA